MTAARPMGASVSASTSTADMAAWLAAGHSPSFQAIAERLTALEQRINLTSRLVVTPGPDGALDVDAQAVMDGDHDIRYWPLVYRHGRWHHRASGESGPLCVVLGAIAATYRHGRTGASR